MSDADSRASEFQAHRQASVDFWSGPTGSAAARNKVAARQREEHLSDQFRAAADAYIAAAKAVQRAQKTPDATGAMANAEGLRHELDALLARASAKAASDSMA